MIDFRTAETKIISLATLCNNTGQLDGVPANPRRIKEKELAKLKKSLAENPEFLESNPLKVIANPKKRGSYVIIGGNMRRLALKQLGYEKCPCLVLDEDTPKEKLKAYIALDNSSFGEWDFKELAVGDWDFTKVGDWGVELPDDFLQERGVERAKKKAWHKAEGYAEPLCDMREHFAVYKKINRIVCGCFRRSKEGVPFSDCKADDFVSVFVDAATGCISGLLSDLSGWCVVIPPPRRHTESNFATKVAAGVAGRLGITFSRNAIINKGNRDRFHPVFELCEPPKEKNIILYDDIITTGLTIRACLDLLKSYNVLVVCGIANTKPLNAKD